MNAGAALAEAVRQARADAAARYAGRELFHCETTGNVNNAGQTISGTTFIDIVGLDAVVTLGSRPVEILGAFSLADVVPVPGTQVEMLYRLMDVTTATELDRAPVLFPASPGRTLTGSTTSGSPNIGGTFFAGDAGQPISGTGIPANSYVGTVTSPTTATLSTAAGAAVNATATSASLTLTVGMRLRQYSGGRVLLGRLPAGSGTRRVKLQAALSAVGDATASVVIELNAPKAWMRAREA